MCLGCSKEIRKRVSKNNMKYCSLECYRTSLHPELRKGSIVQCNHCGQEVYKYRCHIEKHRNYFCSLNCANQYQSRNKKVVDCKICGKQLNLSPSSARIYCSQKCRDGDSDWIRNACIEGNLVQQKKKGLNKLELAGRGILDDIGIEFDEQVLMFDKFLVDVLVASSNLVIQWDGNYWHSKPKRIQLDRSQDAYLKKCGYNVLRFWESDVKKNKEKVIANIKAAV